MNPARIALLDRGLMTIAEEITSETYERLLEEIFYLESKGSPDMELRISSLGGKVAAGLDIYDLVRKYDGHVTGIVYRTAQSMAAVVLQACDRRVCLPHAEILIHSVRTQMSYDELTDNQLLQKEVTEAKSFQDAKVEIFCTSTGKKEKEIRTQLKRNKHMSSQEALDFGLIDEIWSRESDE